MTHRTLVLGGAVAVAAILGVADVRAQGAAGEVKGIKVQPDQAPDCTSLKSMVETVTRGCKNNDEKAIAIYNFMQLTHYHRNYPNEPGGIPVLKEINCYGWSLCGGLHSEQSALWRELGWEWRFVGWDGHTTVEAQYDGRWHYLDVFLKYYAWMPDGKGGRTIAGEDDLTKNTQLVSGGYELDKGHNCVYANDNRFVMNGDKANWQAPAFLCCGDSIQDVVKGLKTHRGHERAEAWAGINHATGNYSMDVSLAPGFCLENTWDPMPDAWYWAGNKTPPAHTCPGHKDTRNSPGYGNVLEPYINSKPARSYGNAILTFTPDLANDACLKSFVSAENVKVANKAVVPADAGKPASVVVSLNTPYILTKASGEAVGADSVEVSVDGGKTFKPADIKDFSEAVKGKISALVKITIKDSLTSLKLQAIVQNNPGALPYLSPGKNRVTISVADAQALGANKLVVTYAYRLGSRTKSFEQLCDQGKEVARQHNAKWSDTVTYVQKTFAAKDLPAAFDIDCPTPKGQYPVYPRMMFMRREVLSPASTPQPLPEGAVEAKAAATDELATLPNPFLVGTQAPEPVKARQVKTVQIPLTYVQYVDDKGEVANTGILRWPKVAEEAGKVVAGAVVVSGDLAALPAKGIVAARLQVPVTAAHNKTALKLGAVLLRQPVESGKACDVKSLTDTVGTAVIPMQPADTPEYKPAKVFPVDVTRGVKAVANGEAKFNGFALRVVPDRSTDEGYTVRCTVSPTDKMWLEIDTYAE